jgi:hypothetical protein
MKVPNLNEFEKYVYDNIRSIEKYIITYGLQDSMITLIEEPKAFNYFDFNHMVGNPDWDFAEAEIKVYGGILYEIWSSYQEEDEE